MVRIIFYIVVIAYVILLCWYFITHFANEGSHHQNIGTDGSESVFVHDGETGEKYSDGNYFLH
jgi:hypothetical protein